MEFPRDCADPAAMQALGREIAVELASGGVLALDGELGAGKTELVKGLAAEVGFEGLVTSPTFPLVHEYRTGRQALFHFDFYRVGAVEEVLDLGWDEFLEEPGSIMVIEWASRFPELWPPTTMALELTFLPGGARRVTLQPLISARDSS
jgi:tRNA threonylcarbamoyladenosine biosynthesis protein TsaE